MAEQIDATVANELAEVQADAGGLDSEALKRVIDGLTINSPGYYYLLQGPDGRAISGNMTAIRPTPGLRGLDRTHQMQGHHAEGSIRGRGVTLSNGAYLFVGVSDRQLDGVREVVTRTFIIDVVMTVASATVGGLR